MVIESSTLYALIIEDYTPDAIIIQRSLDEINIRSKPENWLFFRNYKIESTLVSSIEQAQEVLRAAKYDFILCDLTLGAYSPQETLNQAYEISRNVPLIILSGSDNLNNILSAVKFGVQDFLVKGQYTTETLAQSIRYSVERYRVQRDLDRASQHKSQFLANMSHELRTPLTVILGYADMIRDKRLETDQLENASKVIIRNAKHLIALIDDVLDLSRIEAGQMTLSYEYVSLDEILNLLHVDMGFRAISKGINFKVVRESALPDQIEIDKKRLLQVLINLAGNAIKFTDHGEVSLGISYDFGHRLLTCRVSDTGIGIENETQKNLFQPFSQADNSTSRRFGGTGLGLFLSKQLVESMKGDISLSSSYGQGTTVEANIPCRHSSLAHQANGSNTASAPINSEKFTASVLLVEDSTDNQDMLRLMLHELGLSVVIANDGVEAIEEYKKGKFDVVLMDMHMPRMDGYAATQELRKLDNNIPILAVTAKALDGAKDKCLQAGCTHYLCKPFEFDDLRQIISLMLSPDVQKPAHPQKKSRFDKRRRELAERFINGIPERLKSIEAAFTNSDWKKLETEAHQLANAQMFWAEAQVGGAARTLEAAVVQRNVEEIKKLIVHIKRAAETDCAEFKNREVSEQVPEQQPNFLKAEETKL